MSVELMSCPSSTQHPPWRNLVVRRSSAMYIDWSASSCRSETHHARAPLPVRCAIYMQWAILQMVHCTGRGVSTFLKILTHLTALELRQLLLQVLELFTASVPPQLPRVSAGLVEVIDPGVVRSPCLLSEVA
jgi:hypothetical protein